MSLRYACVTSGMTGRRLDDALRMLADCGYDGVVLRLDHPHPDAFVPLSARRARRLGEMLDTLDLERVVETGTRHVLDPRRKPFPGFLDDARERRIELVRRAVDVASGLGAGVVSFCPGSGSGELHPSIAWQRLQDACEQVLAHAERRDVMLGFEPEPGVLSERIAEFDALCLRLGRPRRLGLTLDLGHGVQVEPEPIRRCGERLVHVRVEDMHRGVDAAAALAALAEAGYRRLVGVELSRQAHAPAATAPQALGYMLAHERARRGAGERLLGGCT